MGIIEQAEEEVTAAAPKVFDALASIKFLLITVPLVSALIGLATHTLTTERNIGTIQFELGSFASPGRRESGRTWLMDLN